MNGLLPRRYEVNRDYMRYGGKAFFKIVQEEDEEDEEGKRALELIFLALPGPEGEGLKRISDNDFDKVSGVW